jgi:hypothetical protein
MAKQPYTEVSYVSPESEGDPPLAEDAHHPEHNMHPPVEEKPRAKSEDNGMGKRIAGFLVAVIVGYLLYVGYQRYKASHAEDGAIHSDDTSVRATNGDNEETPAPRQRPAIAQPTTVATPASDSIAPQPANGMAFAGSGKFQVYRQGNLTWRVDTESGQSCILFATMEEWHKPIVYNHACSNG